MKEQIYHILVNASSLGVIHSDDFISVAKKIEELLKTPEQISEDKYADRKAVEVDFLEKYNRIKKHYCDKRGVKFVRARVVAKPSQLHARLKTYTMDELGTVMYNVFNDNFHVDTKWKYATTDYMTRQPTIEKYLTA